MLGLNFMRQFNSLYLDGSANTLTIQLEGKEYVFYGEMDVTHCLLLGMLSPFIIPRLLSLCQ